MAKKDKLTEVAETIGGALGKADRKAHQVAKTGAKAAKVAQKELGDISKQLDALKKQLEKTAKNLKEALES
jgi:hypothetical protein